MLSLEKIPTQKMIAQACNLSRATVGAILSGDERSLLFSEKTRSKVLQTAERLNYRPNRAAQVMRKGRSNLVAVIYYGAAFHVGRNAADCLPQALAAHGYEFLVFDFLWHGGYLAGIIQEIIQYRVEGVILLGLPANSFTKEHSQMLERSRIPVVALDCDEDLPEVSSCYCDSRPAIMELTQHLLSLGHKTLFMIVPGQQKRSRNISERVEGFREVISSSGKFEICSDNQFFPRWVKGQPIPKNGSISGTVITLPVSSLFGTSGFMQMAYDFSKRLFATKYLPDAIMSSNDEGAIGVFNAAHEFDIDIPKDLAVTGYDDDHLGGYPSYSLTTARQEVEKSCSATVQLLMEQIQTGYPSSKTRVFSPTVVLRNSCGRKSLLESTIQP